MGHMDGSVPPRYTHITRQMRDGLMAGLTAEWEGTLDARLAMCPTPPAPSETAPGRLSVRHSDRRESRRAKVPQRAQAVKTPPTRAVCAGRGHDHGTYFFLPWFLTASIAAAAASGSRYVPPGLSGLKSASSS